MSNSFAKKSLIRSLATIDDLGSYPYNLLFHARGKVATQMNRNDALILFNLHGSIWKYSYYH